MPPQRRRTAAECLTRCVALLLSICCVPRLRASLRGQAPRRRGGSTSSNLMEKWMPIKEKSFEELSRYNDLTKFVEQGYTPCDDGIAGDEYPCRGIDMVYFLPHTSIRKATLGNDIWGWTDPATGKEYILAGQYEQTAIVEIVNNIVADNNDGAAAVVKLVPVAVIPHPDNFWSDIKVYNDHVYIGSEARLYTGSEEGIGIQVYDLTQLRALEEPGGRTIVELTPDSVYNEGMRSHNVVINEESGYLYAVGSKNGCDGGLHIVDILDPSSPTFVTCYGDEGYIHDAECVIYIGPDVRYQSREICFCYNGDSLTILDVHDKLNIRRLSKTGYDGSRFTHQGWCTDDHRYLFLNDEEDERKNRYDQRTHTYLWDIRDLENPNHFGDYYAAVDAIDHNLYVRGNLVFESNYGSGLRVLDIPRGDSIATTGTLKEIAFFDAHPEEETDGVDFVGVWSSYVYFESGYIAVSSVERGIFLLELNANNSPLLSYWNRNL